VSTLLYGLAWSYREWRSRPQSLFSTAIVFASPVGFIASLAAVKASNTLNTMVFGGQAQASSNYARLVQLDTALDHVAHRPWGYGAGQSGLAMGYSSGDFITIDNYFISLILDYGVLGALFWYATFLIGIFYAVRFGFSRRYMNRKESDLLVPLAVALCAFLVVKWVHGQYDLHSTEYMMLGMISALVLRLRTDRAGTSG
jgi:O-antigen ligase